MKEWSDWEIIRRRVSVGGVVTCDAQPLATAVVEVASKASNRRAAVERNDQRTRFVPAGTKPHGFFYLLDLLPGTYVVRVSKDIEEKEWKLFSAVVPETEEEDDSPIWKNFDIPCSN